MNTIYHIVAPPAWDPSASGPYRPASLTSEGFIHCALAEQVARIANLFYGQEKELAVLEIDVPRLRSPVRLEAAPDGERFPHVYGPIDCEAVARVLPLERDGENRWSLKG